MSNCLLEFCLPKDSKQLCTKYQEVLRNLMHVVVANRLAGDLVGVQEKFIRVNLMDVIE